MLIGCARIESELPETDMAKIKMKKTALIDIGIDSADRKRISQGLPALAAEEV